MGASVGTDHGLSGRHSVPRRMTHDEVVEAARRWIHIPFRRAALTECGLPSIGTARSTIMRVDVLGYEPTGVFRIVECKATKADARRLPWQLMRYRRYAHFLYVAAPAEWASELEVPKGIGLLAVSRDTFGLSCVCLRRPRRAEVEERVQSRMHARVLTYLLTKYEELITSRRSARV